MRGARSIRQPRNPLGLRPGAGCNRHVDNIGGLCEGDARTVLAIGLAGNALRVDGGRRVVMGSVAGWLTG